MTGDELLTMFRGMTPAPWSDDYSCVQARGDKLVALTTGESHDPVAELDHDARGIAILGSHAAAFADLVKACEVCEASVPPLVLAALARVHAVRRRGRS